MSRGSIVCGSRFFGLLQGSFMELLFGSPLSDHSENTGQAGSDAQKIE
jgi:hypothetical protein